VTLDDEIYIGKCVFQRGAAPARTLQVLADDRCVLVVRTADGVRQDRYQVHDQVASVTLEIAADQSVLTRETYFPYGGTAAASGATPADLDDKRYRFNGKQRDTGTELYYYGQRYYAPWQLRWISADPAGTIDGLNLFAFVGGNPVTRYDADGTNGDDPPPATPPPSGPLSWRQHYQLFVQTYRTPTPTHQSLPYLLKGWAYQSAVTQAVFDVLEGTATHGSTSALLSLSQSALAAKFGGLFGLVYPSVGIYKAVSQRELPSSTYVALFAANLAYLRESQLLFRALYTHGLERQIGFTGAFAAAGKVYAAFRNDDPKSATVYSLLGVANLRFGGVLTRLPKSPYLFAAGVVAALIPSEYYNYPYRTWVKPTYLSATGKLKSLTQLPPEGHWTESPNVLIDSLRTTAGIKPRQTPTPRKKQSSQ
jgi:RHS repeat-associated protein